MLQLILTALVLSRPLLAAVVARASASSNTPTLSSYNLTSYPTSFPVKGGVARTDTTLSDDFDVDIISPTPYQVTVDVNTNPVGPYVVSTMGGQPWLLINPYSWKISFNTTAADFIGAKLEAPYDPDSLEAMGIAVDNTYIGKLSDDGTHWIVDSDIRNVHHSENVTRIVGMTELAGEYALLGRYTVDVANWYIQYGYYPFAATRTFNVTNSNALVNGIFTDKLQLQIASKTAIGLNANVFSPVKASLPSGYSALTPYYYRFNTTDSSVKVTANVMLPYTQHMLDSNKITGPECLQVAHAPSDAGPFAIAEGTHSVDTRRGYVTATGITSLDGIWIIIGNW